MKTVVKSGDPRLLSLWLESLDERNDAEFGLLHAVVCDPAEGVRLSRALGISGQHFDRWDLKLIYLACELAGRFGQPTVFSLACRALIVEGYWDDDLRSYTRGPRWSEASLAAFFHDFCQFAPTPMQKYSVAEYGKRLLDVIARQRDAEAHYKEACRLLRNDPLRMLDRKGVAA